MTLNIKRVYHNLILFGLMVMPLLTFTEINALMSATSVDHSQLLTPWYIKGIKDFIFVLIILIGMLEVVNNRRKIKFEYTFIFFYFFILLSILISLINNDLMIIFAGIRWLFPLLVLPFLINRIDNEFQTRVAKLLMLLVFIGLIFQLMQTVTLDTYFGPNQFGFSKRNPGFFTIPSTMSIFLLFSLWYVFHFLDKTRFNNFFIYFIMPISIFLAGSATGILVMLIFYLSIFYTKVKQKRIIFISSVIFVIVIFIMLSTIMHRADLMQSIITRIGIFQTLSFTNILIGDRFGLATNTAILLQGFDNGDAFIADSLIVSFIVNTGLVCFLVFVYIVLKNGEKTLKYFHFLMITAIFSFNSILFEVYPANLLISVSLAYFISLKYSSKIRRGSEDK